MKHNTQLSYLDIIFKGRNKEYGAYELRTNYDKRLYIALSITIVLCLSIILSAFAVPKKHVTTHYKVSDVTISQIKEPVKKEEFKKKVEKTVPVKTVKFTAPIIVDKVNVKNQFLEIDNNAKIGTENIEGPISDTIQAKVEEIGTETKTVEVDNNVEFKSVEVEAKFPGGFKAWKRFLETTLDASIPVYNGAPEGTYSIVVSFLVDKEGNVSEVKALNDPGFGIAEEAVKVIKKSKTWSPAMNNNVKVIYRQKQVIVFQVNGE
jgi:protein TonB